MKNIIPYILVAAGSVIIGYFIGEQRIKISFGSPTRTRLGQPRSQADRLTTYRPRF